MYIFFNLLFSSAFTKSPGNVFIASPFSWNFSSLHSFINDDTIFSPSISFLLLFIPRQFHFCYLSQNISFIFILLSFSCFLICSSSPTPLRTSHVIQRCSDDRHFSSLSIPSPSLLPLVMFKTLRYP